MFSLVGNDSNTTKLTDSYDYDTIEDGTLGTLNTSYGMGSSLLRHGGYGYMSARSSK